MRLHGHTQAGYSALCLPAAISCNRHIDAYHSDLCKSSTNKARKTFGSETLARLYGGNAQLLSDNSPQHLFFPCDSTFKEQYTVWPKRNADIIRTYEESVIPYLDNLGENDAEKEKLSRR
jgi:hypothetical protein